MKVNLMIKNSLLVFLLIMSPYSVAAGLSDIEVHEKNFNFNWNNYNTIPAAKNKIAAITEFLNAQQDYSSLTPADREALAKLNYKAGTYYTHITRQTDAAIARFNVADALFEDKKEKAMNYNNLAYAYELKYASTGASADKSKALAYVTKAINQLFPDKKNPEVAFAYCVKGLVLSDAKKYLKAEVSYLKAMKIYEALPSGKDNQYYRAKNRLAGIMLQENGRDKEALAMLKEVNQYWHSKGNIAQDPYAARNYILLGQAYLKLQNNKLAVSKFKTAVGIYKNVYGEKSALLSEPYQLLVESYKNSGDEKQASSYQNKVDVLNKTQG